MKHEDVRTSTTATFGVRPERTTVMSDDEGMESFSMNDRDMQNAINPGQRKRMSKNQQIYGMWAEDSDDESDRRRQFGGSSRGGGGAAKNYSAPVAFVSGGVKIGSKEIPAEHTANSDDDDDRPTTSDAQINAHQEDNDDEPIELRPSKLRTKEKKNRPFASAANAKTFDTSAFAGLRAPGGIGAYDKSGMGEWEKHTKGIGMKLMQKMGYKPGEGLGAKGEGIVEPVVAKVRPGRGAVGVYGPEAKGPKMAKTGKSKDGSTDEDEKAPAPQPAAGRWRKADAAAAPKSKYKFRTMDEVIEEGGVMHKRLVMFSDNKNSTKVIDMTGKKHKTYTGYDAFTQKQIEHLDPTETTEPTKQKRAFDVSELSHNLNLLLEMTEDEIIRDDKRRRYLDDQRVALTHDRASARVAIDAERAGVDRMNACLRLVEEFGRKSRAGELLLADSEAFFTVLLAEFAHEYKLFSLDALIVTSVLPLMRTEVFSADWVPFPNGNDERVDVLRRWRRLVEADNAARALAVDTANMDVYHRLVWETWMPPVRRYICDVWQPKQDYAALIDLIHTYAPVLPKWILENLFEQCILSRISAAADSWLHPWRPFLDEQLQHTVFAGVRHKLAKALAHWTPLDPSARAILLPWAGVFKQGVMDAFLAQHIVPKLGALMSGFVVNPANQQLGEWKALMSWIGLIGTATIANLLHKHFFPKWHMALYTWLTSTNPDFTEVSQWYQGWKSLFAQELLELTPVKRTSIKPVDNKKFLCADQFTRALEQMNRCVHGSAPIPPPPVGGVQSSATTGGAPSQLPALLRGAVTAPQPLMSFKDLVEKRAADNGIAYMPVTGKSRQDKQVYWFGTRQVFVDRNVLFTLDDTTAQWTPVALDALVAHVSADAPR